MTLDKTAILSQITLRDARKSDAKAILDLVIELAEYEKAADQVITDVATYEKVIANQEVFCKVAELEGEIIGIALYYKTFSTWRGLMYYLEDLVVREQYRRYGIGRKLIDAFIEHAKEDNAALVKWQVLDWNEPAIQFYKKLNATIEDEWYNVKIKFK